ncbi:hypothetical protein N7512_008535 [Penicillium capsulatum]|nr:hypothetical protein N7512_008535 [Penicillium capsulatum]
MCVDIINTSTFRNKPDNFSQPRLKEIPPLTDDAICLPKRGCRVGGRCKSIPRAPSPDTPVHSYDRQCVIERILPPYSVKDRFVVIKDFPPEKSDKDEEDLPRYCDYSRPVQILIIKMPSQAHEEAAAGFEKMITMIANDMQVIRRIAFCGATRVSTRTETSRPTEQDVAWWINESRGEVGMGITVDIKGSGCIDIKSWIPAFDPSLQHDYVTASGRHVQPMPITFHRLR